MMQSAENETAAEAPAEAPTKPAAKKRLLMLIAAGALVAIAVAGGAGWYFGLFERTPQAVAAAGGADAAAEGAATAAAVPEPVYYELPDVLVSLNTGERRSTFLKLRLSLELGSDADRPRIERLLPRITDYCQVYLRELRLEDLRGSAGTLRLREELLRRIAAAVAPVAVKDVLFSELFIQ